MLIDLVRAGDIAAIERLDPSDPAVAAAVNESDGSWGFSALGWACWLGEVEIAHLLLDCFNPDPDFRSRSWDGELATPLHLACEVERYCARAQEDGYESRQIPLVERLIALGADVHHRDVTGNTAYSRALGRRHYAIADLLERHGCGSDDHLVGWRDAGPIEVELECGADPEHVRQLLRRGAAVRRPYLAEVFLQQDEENVREWAEGASEPLDLEQELARIAEVRALLAEELKRRDLIREEELAEMERNHKAYERSRWVCRPKIGPCLRGYLYPQPRLWRRMPHLRLPDRLRHASPFHKRQKAYGSRRRG